MNLSPSLLHEFAKTTKDETEKPKEYTAYGKVVSVNTQAGTCNVLIDGAETPVVCKSITTVKQNDRVKVEVKNRQATVTGNATSKTINGDVLVDGNGTFRGDVYANNGTFHGRIEAESGYFKGNVEFDHTSGAKVKIGREFFTPLYLDQGAYGGQRTMIDAGRVIIDEYAAGGWNTSMGLYGFNVSDDSQTSYNYGAYGPQPGSDVRLKKDITSIDPNLAKNLRPVGFKYINTNKQRYGFIAQEVEPVFPDAVITDENGYLSLLYLEFLAPTLALAQENAKQIEILKAELEELRKEVKILGETKDNSVPTEKE